MRPALLALALFAAPPARAATPRLAVSGERPLNPDRWPTLELDVSGLSPWKSDQVVVPRTGAETDSRRQSLDTAASLFTVLPLSDAFSLNLGFGGDWSEVETANAGANGSTTDDSSVFTYRGGGRWYFEDEGSTRWRATHNPDRWPSLGLTMTGTQLYKYGTGNATGNTFSENSSDSQTLILDTRLPVADAWTLTLGAGGTRSAGESKTSAAGPTTVNLSGSWTASAGVRYFFVGRNFILNDGGVNPDMWSMVSLNASGGRTVYGRQTLAAGKRDTESMTETVTAGARLPVTDHCSLNFSTQLQYSRYYSPPYGATSGVLTRTATVTFNAGARYFLF